MEDIDEKIDAFSEKIEEAKDKFEQAKDKFEEAWNKNYIVQKVIPHGRVMVPMVRHNSVKWIPNFYMLGAYLIDGKPQSMEAKLSSKERIGMSVEAGEPRGFRTAVFRTKF